MLDVILPLYYLITAHQSQRAKRSADPADRCPVADEVQIFLLAQTREETNGTFAPIVGSGAHLFGYGMVGKMWWQHNSATQILAHVSTPASKPPLLFHCSHDHTAFSTQVRELLPLFSSVQLLTYSSMADSVVAGGAAIVGADGGGRYVRFREVVAGVSGLSVHINDGFNWDR
jgi:hypothetical protein